MTDYTAEDLEVYRAACEARERHASEACPVCGHAVETPADTT